MQVPLLSTAYWPPIAYFYPLLAARACTIEAHEHYQKQSLRTRCTILGANGRQNLIVPVVKVHGAKMPVDTVRIDYSESWPRVHWKALVSAYRNAAFFEYYASEIKPFYTRKWDLLLDYNEAILRTCLRLLGIEIPLYRSHEYEARVPDDYRSCLPKDKAVPYYQVFSQRHGFVSNLSILDLICNEGPGARAVLEAEPYGE